MQKLVKFPVSELAKPARLKQQERRLVPEAAKRDYHRVKRVTIAPGIAVTTMSGSMYASMLKVLAVLGHLDRHAHLFKVFSSTGTVSAAHQLFQEIAVARTDMEKHVRADADFREHCDKRTRDHKRLAAHGSKKYQNILKNPRIFQRGRWIGDLEEGINILSGGRTLAQVRKGKNLQILNKAGLMFDTMTVGSTQFCFLYPQKFHRAFLKAATLVQQIPM